MAHRSPLLGGAPRLLGSHAGAEGKAYRKCFDALAGDLGPFTPLQTLEAGRVAAAWVALVAATRALNAAQRARRLGKGRRPSVTAVEKLARRQGLADGSYGTALDKLQALCRTTKARRLPTAADLIVQQRARAGAGVGS